jgi:hypothetical protein
LKRGAHDHIGEPLDQREGVDPVLGGEEFDIGLVQKHHGVRRHPLQEQLDVGGRLDGAGRIVRTADHHDPRLACRLGHGSEVVVAVLVQRHGDRNQPGHLGEDRIAVECPGSQCGLGLVTALSTCMITPVAPAPMTTACALDVLAIKQPLAGT